MSQKESRQLEIFGGKLLFETGAEEQSNAVQLPISWSLRLKINLNIVKVCMKEVDLQE